MGEAQQWWLHHSLKAFSLSLEQQGLRLIIQRGPSESVLYNLARESGARSVFWNKVYEPTEATRDSRVANFLHENGIETVQWNSQLLHDPTKICTGKGTPYKVFTPFWNTIKKTLAVPDPLGFPKFTPHQATLNAIHSLRIEDLSLLPKVNWAAEFHNTWEPGEATATHRMESFLEHTIGEYSQKRDFPFLKGTSMLSPHLHFGEVSPRTLWHNITNGQPATHPDDQRTPFLRQLIWREFSYHLIHHFPHTSEKNLRDAFDRFPWSTKGSHLIAWQKGETGYPIVDAGMRQLWRTGWMHNRVRMIVASFLTKHLLTHWIEGAKWFWDTLVDANLPNNTMGWQWAAGSGADAQPFFRIFNPITQGKKFDPKGAYVKKWVPELKRVPTKFIHEPWLLSSEQQRTIHAIIGSHYPYPIVDHKEARELALRTYRKISN